MLNKIWFWLLFIGILYAPLKMVIRPWIPVEKALATELSIEEAAEATPLNEFAEIGKQINEAALNGAQVSVDICISLIAIMVLWLGLLQVAKDAGLVDLLARLLSPLMRWLFPGIPNGHAAQGAILMNMSANMLGLDNAATPFGLKAMKELDELNPEKGTATNAMATFLTINTSSVTLVPISIIGLRYASGSENPSEPVFGIILATFVSTIVGVMVVRWLERMPRFAKTNPMLVVNQESQQGGN